MIKESKTVQSVDRALRIIEFLKNSPRGMGVTELAERLGVSKSTSHRLLMSLYNMDFVRKDSSTDKYLLGLKFIELGEIVSSELDIKEIVHPYLERVTKNVGETSHLAVQNVNHVVYIDKIESVNTLRMFSNIGKKAPIYCTGIGKAILAFLPEEKIDRIINEIEFVKYTKNTITTKSELLEELEWIRENGYAIDNEEHELEIKCAAAPILNYNNEVIAGFSVASPMLRLTDRKFQKIVDEVKAATRDISRILGHREV